MLTGWPCPAGTDPATPQEEFALSLDRGRAERVLVVPPLFDEHNRLRRFAVETMRRLDAAGIDSVLPDLPGTNESLAPLVDQTPDRWRAAMAAAAAHFRVTRILALRGGALVAPEWPGWSYAPITGSAVLRQLLRARILAGRELGRNETHEGLLERGRTEGLELAGYPLGAAMISGLETALPDTGLIPVTQAEVGGAGLWLRAEPGESVTQSEALARRIMTELMA